MAKPSKNYTTDELLKAIKNSAGIYSTIAGNLQCEWHTAKKYIESDEKALTAYNNETERVLDVTENKLFEKIKEGDTQMIKYMLSTKGRKRGYNEKIDLDVSVKEIKPIIE